MTQSREPGTWYDCDAIVEYEGHKYKSIQPHHSQASPEALILIWHLPPAPRPGSAPTSLAKWYRPGAPQHLIFRAESFTVGDGPSLEANAALAGFSGSRWDWEDEKWPAWSREDWLRESEQRTARDYWAGRVAGPVSWILVEGRNIPERAIPGGQERDGSYVYICRAWYEGSLQVGKTGWSCRIMGAIVGYGNKEHHWHLDKYEVLVGDQGALRWTECRGRVDLATLGDRPVEGGREADGTSLFIAQAK